MGFAYTNLRAHKARLFSSILRSWSWPWPKCHPPSPQCVISRYKYVASQVSSKLTPLTDERPTPEPTSKIHALKGLSSSDEDDRYDSRSVPSIRMTLSRSPVHSNPKVGSVVEKLRTRAEAALLGIDGDVSSSAR